MFQLIYWPLVAIFGLSLLFGSGIYTLILGAALSVVGLVALALAVFEKYATVTPIGIPVPWKPISDLEWLFAALVQGILLVLVIVVFFTI